MANFLLPLYLTEEYLLIIKNQLTPFFIKSPPASWQQGSRGDVVIIQSLHERWPFLATISHALNKQGYRIHTLKELGNNTIPMSLAVKIVAQYLNTTHLTNVILLCHSKGGLIAYALAANPSVAKRLKLIITLATPYHGSSLAHFASSSQELLPSSPLFRNLYQTPCPCPILNLYPAWDNHVMPHNSLILKEADNHQVDVVGHTRILESSQIREIILKHLRSLPT